LCLQICSDALVRNTQRWQRVLWVVAHENNYAEDGKEMFSEVVASCQSS